MSDLWKGLHNHQPIQTLGYPNALDIVITKNFPIPVYLTSCCALSSDHLPLIIGATCRSSFHHPPDGPEFRCTEWTNFQTPLNDLVPFDLELHNEIAIDTYV